MKNLVRNIYEDREMLVPILLVFLFIMGIGLALISKEGHADQDYTRRFHDLRAAESKRFKAEMPLKDSTPEQLLAAGRIQSGYTDYMQFVEENK